MTDFEREIIERLTKIETNLEEHMSRTEMAEARLDEHEQKMIEISQTLWMARGAVVLLGILSTIVGLVITLQQVL
jgi:hypothetical protein